MFWSLQTFWDHKRPFSQLQTSLYDAPAEKTIPCRPRGKFSQESHLLRLRGILGESHFAHRTKSSQRICYILQISTKDTDPDVKKQIPVNMGKSRFRTGEKTKQEIRELFDGALPATLRCFLA